MATLNLSVFLNSYADTVSSNAPSLNNFRWNKDVTGLAINNPISQTIQLSAGETRTIWTTVSKKFLYVESDNKISMNINGTANAGEVWPFVIGSKTYPGIYMRSSPITALILTNEDSSNPANVTLIAAE